VDASAADPVSDYRTLRAELQSYGRGLADKRFLVVANKIDLPSAAAGLAALQDALPGKLIALSAQTGRGLDLFLDKLAALVSDAKA